MLQNTAGIPDEMMRSSTCHKGCTYKLRVQLWNCLMTSAFSQGRVSPVGHSFHSAYWPNTQDGYSLRRRIHRVASACESRCYAGDLGEPNSTSGGECWSGGVPKSIAISNICH